MSEERLQEIKVMNNDEIRDFCIKKDLKIFELEQEIERLNKKIEQYENPEDMTLMFMWCDEKAKDEIKRLNNIINEINSIVEYWGYDKEQNDISSFRMAMKSIKDILRGDKDE